MAAEFEVQLDTDLRPRAGAIEANRVAGAARRGRSVQRPRNSLENRGFAGPVRADDAREAGIEDDPRVRVLPEVAEAQRVQMHDLTRSYPTSAPRQSPPRRPCSPLRPDSGGLTRRVPSYRYRSRARGSSA